MKRIVLGLAIASVLLGIVYVSDFGGVKEFKQAKDEAEMIRQQIVDFINVPAEQWTEAKVKNVFGLIKNYEQSSNAASKFEAQELYDIINQKWELEQELLKEATSESIPEEIIIDSTDLQEIPEEIIIEPQS